MSAISFVDSPITVHQSSGGMSSFEKAHGPAFLEVVFEFDRIVQQPYYISNMALLQKKQKYKNKIQKECKRI